jgi:hypothetical protein
MLKLTFDEVTDTQLKLVPFSELLGTRLKI